MRMPHPRLSRTIYRSLLRASQNGKHPEVFGRYGAAVLAHQQQLYGQTTPEIVAAATSLPQTPNQVKHHLKQWFRHDSTAAANAMMEREESKDTGGVNGSSITPVLKEVLESPLEIIRQTNQQKSMMDPTKDLSASALSPIPIIDSDQIVAIPGERIQTIFREPRHTHGLLPLVWASESKLFLLRPKSDNDDDDNVESSSTTTTATLMKLVHMQPVRRSDSDSSPNNDRNREDSHHKTAEREGKDTANNSTSAGAAVICLAGPRVRINKEEPVQSEAVMNYIWQRYGSSSSPDTSATNDRKSPTSPAALDFTASSSSPPPPPPFTVEREQQQESAPPLAFASEYCRQHDDDDDTGATTKEVDVLNDNNNNNNGKKEESLQLRQQILTLLECVLALQQREFLSTMINTGYGLPPLDLEAFSYWALRFVLPTNHIENRSFWLYQCNSTTMRLQCALHILQAILDSSSSSSEAEFSQKSESKEESGTGETDSSSQQTNKRQKDQEKRRNQEKLAKYVRQQLFFDKAS